MRTKQTGQLTALYQAGLKLIRFFPAEIRTLLKTCGVKRMLFLVDARQPFNSGSTGMHKKRLGSSGLPITNPSLDSTNGNRQ